MNSHILEVGLSESLVGFSSNNENLGDVVYGEESEGGGEKVRVEEMIITFL